ncbi:hypothetical protein C173_02289 [Paenibacillus sp. FSL R7-277]|uniref:hypothetical protein n=1 Tax=unclassified Paenibacillus TaxID=185978 RepID=UPI0003E2026B|nr:hypothetical protein [Paenibacillus sp. FSL R7-277]ETT78908.1 hypothetical protein C173_02289 [Paenibacillus sp. FSL R7-277]
MFVRKYILPVFLAALLLCSSITSVHAEGSSNAEAKAFFGTISEIQAATQKQNELNEIPYPIELSTPPEQLKNSKVLADYVEKQRVKADLPTIKKLIENDPSRFSGHYYDADTGMVTVQITEDSESLKALIRKASKNGDKIKFEVTKYSWSDITEAKEKIKKTVQPGTVLALIPDTMNNKLIIALDEKSGIQSKQTVSSLLLEKSDLLVYTTLPASAFKTETDNTNWGSTIPMGAKIGGNYRPNPSNPSQTIYGVCTNGYFGVNASDQAVVVTSGHCQTAGTVSAWYQPTNATSSIGDYTFRTTSPGDGSAGASDSGYITLNSGFSPWARVPYPSSTNMAMITGTYVTDTVGDTIYMRGANSGATTSGTIKYSNVDIWWGSDGYGYNTNEVLASGYTSVGGDSGGPVLTNYAYNNNLSGWTFKLAGTHTGSLTIDQDLASGIKAGTYKVYEALWSTFSDLGLTGLYLISP